jgi:hypothetical protein
MTVRVALAGSNAFQVLRIVWMEVFLPFECIICASLNPIKNKDSGAWELKPFCFPHFYSVEPSR